MIVLIIFIVLGIISIVNNNACNNITLGTTPENFSFDPTINTNFRINAGDARIKSGEIRIFQSPPNGPQDIANIQVYTGSSGITPKLDTTSQNGIFELKITQPGFSLFNIPPRCMNSLFYVYLPSLQLGTSNTIQVDNDNLELTMEKNIFPYNQNISLITNDGNIHLNDIIAQNMNIKTIDGDITGSITSILNELNISVDDGDMNLVLGTAQNPFNSKVSVVTDDGNVILKFNGSSFSGNYGIQTDDGDIRIDNNTPTSVENQKVNGIVGTGGNGNLNIITNDGNVFVSF